MCIFSVQQTAERASKRMRFWAGGAAVAGAAVGAVVFRVNEVLQQGLAIAAVINANDLD